MDVSIILLNYNTFELSCACLNSLIEKTRNINYEIILVDNASTECNPEKFKETFPSIILVKNEINVGFAKGNNLGIKHAKGEYIVLLNSDTELTENSISICYNELIKQDNIGAATCRLVGSNGALQHNCQSFPSATKKILEILRIHKLFSKKLQSDYLQGFYWNYNKQGFPDWIWGTFFMFKKSDLKMLPEGKLNDDFFMYIEDMKWSFDFRKIGLRMFYTPETTIIHHSGGSAGKSNEMVNKNYNLFLNSNYNYIHKKIIKFTDTIK